MLSERFVTFYRAPQSKYSRLLTGLAGLAKWTLISLMAQAKDWYGCRSHHSRCPTRKRRSLRLARHRRSYRRWDNCKCSHSRLPRKYLACLRVVFGIAAAVVPIVAIQHCKRHFPTQDRSRQPARARHPVAKRGSRNKPNPPPPKPLPFPFPSFSSPPASRSANPLVPHRSAPAKSTSPTPPPNLPKILAFRTGAPRSRSVVARFPV